MKRLLLPIALGAACWMPAHAEIPLGTVAGSDVAFEGMFQVDGYWFDNDLRDLDGLNTEIIAKLADAVERTIDILSRRG